MAEPTQVGGVPPRNDNASGNDDAEDQNVPKPNPAENTTDELREPNLRDGGNSEEEPAKE